MEVDIAQQLETAASYRFGEDVAARIEHARHWQEQQAVLMQEAAGVIRALRGELGRLAVEISDLKAKEWLKGEQSHGSREVSGGLG